METEFVYVYVNTKCQSVPWLKAIIIYKKIPKFSTLHLML